MVNSRDDILPYHNLKIIDLFTGCSKFDKTYVDKEIQKKGREAFGAFHLGPESSALTAMILPYYVSMGITVPVLSDCVA